jgi:hypothetical protein
MNHPIPMIEDPLLSMHMNRLQENKDALLENRSYDDKILKSICVAAHYFCISKNDVVTHQIRDMLKITAENLKDFPLSKSISICGLLNKDLPRNVPNWMGYLSLFRKDRRAAKVRNMFYKTVDYDRPQHKLVP